MASNQVVGVFDSYADAEDARKDLIDAGFDDDSIRITANDERETVDTLESGSSVGTRARATSTSTSAKDESLGDRISNFFSSLFGDDREDATHYSEAVRRGSAVVIVDADSADDAERAADILDERGVVDVQKRAEEWKQSGWAGSEPSALTSRSTGDANLTDGGKTVIPVVKEELQVGKRRIDRGGVRIYTHMTENAVEENVRLREEHATVTRRPADRPASEADLAAFKEGTIEVRETAEEAVVGKRARVVEEVVVGKESSERRETVRGTVRQGNVDVEKLEAGGTRQSTARSGATYDDLEPDYRSHWQTNFAGAGGAYDEYSPAYRYGSSLADDTRYRDRDWNDLEVDARRDWETRNPNSSWEKFKAAVRHGWERMTNRR